LNAVLSSLAAYLAAGVRPPTPLAKAIVLVLVVKLMAIVGAGVFLVSSSGRPRSSTRRGLAADRSRRGRRGMREDIGRMLEFDPVGLAATTIAVTALYHFLFVPLTLGLSFLLAVMEKRVRDDRTGNLA